MHGFFSFGRIPNGKIQMNKIFDIESYMRNARWENTIPFVNILLCFDYILGFPSARELFGPTFSFPPKQKREKKHDRRRKQTSQSFVLASSFQCDSYFVWSYYLGIGLHSTWFTLDTVFTQPMATAWPSQPTNQRQCWRRCISVSVTSYTGNAILIKWNTVQNKSWHQILLFVVNM